MAQDDSRINPSPRSRESYPYLVEVQSDGIAMMLRRIVVPLVRKSHVNTLDPTLNHIFDVNGETYMLLPVEIAGVAEATLGDVIGCLRTESDLIVGALDLLFARY